MTLSFRNGILTFLLALTGVVSGFFLYAAFLAQQTFGWDAVLPAQQQSLFWIWTVPAKEVRLYQVIIESLTVLPIAFCGLLYLRQIYRKTNASEVFFFAVFLSALPWEGLRIVQVFLLLQNQPFFWGVVLTRVLWSFRLFGLFTLFCGSLFSLSFSYQKFGNLVIVSLLISLFLGVNLPLQTTVTQTNLLFALGDERGLGLIFLFFCLMTLGNFGFGALNRIRERASTPLVTALLFLVAWQGLFFGAYWAGILMIPAFILIGRKTQESYLWN